MSSHVSDRRALIVVAAQFYLNGAVYASFAPRLPEIRDRVGVSVTAIGLVLSLAGLSGLAGSATVGRVIDRLGTRRVMVGGTLIMAGGLTLIGLAESVWLLIAGLVGILLFDVWVDVAMNIEGSRLSDRRRVPVMNRLHGLWSVGTLAGGLVTASVAATGVSPPVHLTIAALVVVTFALATLAAYPASIVDVTPAQATATAAETTGSPARPLLAGRSTLVLIGVAGFVALAVEVTSIEWAAFRLSDDFAARPGVATRAYVAVAAGMSFGRLVGDWVQARIGTAALEQSSALIAGLGLAVACLVPSATMAIAGFGLAGLGVAALMPGLYDLAAKTPGRIGSGLGALTAGLRIAGFGVPLLVGLLAGSGLAVGTAIALVALPSTIGFAASTRRLRAVQPAA